MNPKRILLIGTIALTLVTGIAFAPLWVPALKETFNSWECRHTCLRGVQERHGFCPEEPAAHESCTVNRLQQHCGYCNQQRQL